jgi:hypothetical protein
MDPNNRLESHPTARVTSWPDRALAAFLLQGVFLLGCAAAEVTDRPGGGGSVGGVPGSAGPGAAPPAFTLPDAGPRPAAPPAGPPSRQCAEEAHQAQIVPLDLLLLVDSSSSMDRSAGMHTKWQTAQIALSAFIRDPMSAGLGVGLQFFPSSVKKPCMTDSDCLPGLSFPGLIGFELCRARSVCGGPNVALPGPSCGGTSAAACPAASMCLPAGTCSGDGLLCTNVGQGCPGMAGTCMPAGRTCVTNLGTEECAPASYEKPVVAIGTLPTAQMPLLSALNANEPLGGTPMGPAVRGALGQLRVHLQANPGRKAVLVLVGDGIPSSSCPMNDIPAIAVDIGGAYMGTPSIPTYVIGVFTPEELMMSQMQLDTLAMAGGSNRAIVLAANNDLTQRLQEALNQIRGAALACEYQIPPPSSGRIDFGQVNVRHSGGGATENIPYVERADRCDPMRGGWYYDVPPAMGVPTRILTCEATCRHFRTDTAGKVELVFGCSTRVID